MAMYGGNGQWVRARNKAGAASFIAEKEMERQRFYDRRERSRRRFKRCVVIFERAMQAVGHLGGRVIRRTGGR